AYLKGHPVDAIVSTGPPHSMHLIARELALKTGLPWVADFRDPWTKLFYFKHLALTSCSRRRHEKLEKQVLDDASLVVAVSPMVQEEFRTMTSTPVALVTNGYDEEDYAPALKPNRSASCSLQSRPDQLSFFRITHTGLFARDGIPSVLWDVLAEKSAEDPVFKEKLRIVLVGKSDREVLESLVDAGLKDKVMDLGYQAHAEAVARQLEADVLLLPLRKEPEYRAVLPGKLFEYLGAARPMLGIGEPDGAMAKILREILDDHPDAAPDYLVCDWEDKSAMKAYIDRAWDMFLKRSRVGGRNDADFPLAGPAIEAVSRYSRKNTTAAMARLLDKVCPSKDDKSE
nr:hypothetical protein [Bacteroidales bacterium]